MFERRKTVLSLVGILLAIPCASAQTTIDLSQPVSKSLKPDTLYWSFDQGTVGESQLVEDESGNGFDGQPLAGSAEPEPACAKGKFGAGLHFPWTAAPVANADGKFLKPNARVTWRPTKTSGSADGPKLDMSGKSFTAGLWIQLDKIHQGESQGVVLMHRGFVNSAWMFSMVKDSKDQWAFALLRAKSTEKTQVLNDGKWHHLAFSYNANDGIVTYWLDGEVFGAPVAATEKILASQAENDLVFTLGERNVANFSTGFSGTADDVFVTTGTHGFKP